MSSKIRIRHGKDLNVHGTKRIPIETTGLNNSVVNLEVDIKVYRNKKIRVVFTETPQTDIGRRMANEGTSVTNMIEQLATELINGLPKVFNGVPVDNITWYERYMSYGDPIVTRSICRVKLCYIPRVGFSNPDWTPVWRSQFGSTS